MSGGQMQRVAIARALVNNPDILLADEPTGALDTTTSVQIMDLLREVAKTKLVIMVTHNPELAEEYSTRIIRLKDGEIVGDTNPFVATEAPDAAEEALAEEAVAPKVAEPEQPKKNSKGKRSMSFFTALSLSLNNLMTKKTRTLLVSVAGSIGIIGIALILALSNGVNLFIASVQEETLTSYPISITAETTDYSAMLSAMVGTSGADKENRDPNKIYVDDSISNMVGAMTTMDKNNLAKFNEYLKSRYDEIKDDLTAIQYSYDMDLQIFNASTQYGENGVLQVSPSGILSEFGDQYGGLSMITDSISIFSEIMPGRDGQLINDTVYEQYQLVDGKWPENETELVLVVDRNNTVANITLYMLGLLDPDEMTAMMASMMLGEKYDAKTEGMSFTYQDFYNLDLNLGYNSDFYTKLEGDENTYEVDGTKLQKWDDLRDNDGFLPETVYDKGIQLKIVGVICPSEDASSTSITGAIGYTSALTQKVLGKVNDSEIVNQQITYPSHDVFTGLPFQLDDVDTLTDAQKKEKLEKYFSTLTATEKADLLLAIRTKISDATMAGYLTEVKKTISTTEDQREFLINLYAFNSKNGSLAVGTFANKAVATILHAIDTTYTIEQYQTMVATQYAAAFELDGKEVKKDGDGAEAYTKYAGLIDALYSTPEKLAQAFDNMTAMTIRSVYPMIEGINIQKELMAPTAPHFLTYMAKMHETYPTDQAKMGYLMGMFCMTNGLYDPNTYQPNLNDPLTQAYLAYLATADIPTEFSEAVYKEYTSKLTSDEVLRAEATAALLEQYLAGLTEAEYAALYADHMEKSESTYEENLITIGANMDDMALSAIHIYPVDFDAKERLTQIITDYNNQEGLDEEDQISYTDIVAIMMSSVTIIIDAITYVLIAFVSISLVVSSIMIGIITYISVLERTKEIGILRAIGASKKDISRVFNAETLIIGFAAGAIGILTTVILCLPINLILKAVTDMNNIKAVLPLGAAFILIGISMVLTLIAGLIPSGIAAKKDPVVALRTE
ncbi:MAG: FtsX-like permease family protein [Clostridia bacterium]|nr:FtsX-like permease family protein [Clostridia bacterium]